MPQPSRPDAASEKREDVRLYGRRLSEGETPLLSVLYYGFKAGLHEVRIPTARIFHIRPEDVLASGDVPDYEVPGAKIEFFDLPIRAEVNESRPQALERPRRIELSAEIITTTGGTFAGLVATPPTPRVVDMDALESLPREELLAQVRTLMAREEGGFGGDETLGKLSLACNTYRQSYYWTFFSLDPWGADCD